jgi:hypothetical protein
MSYGDYLSANLRTGPSMALRTGVEELTKSRTWKRMAVK